MVITSLQIVMQILVYSLNSSIFSILEIGILEFRQHKDPNYELVQSQKDVGFQAGELLVNSSTQTNWFRCLNHALQVCVDVLQV